jgi:hypothetical protein
MLLIALVAALYALALYTAAVTEGVQPKKEAPGANDSLGDQLEKGQGVIKPKRDIDPKLAKPAPEMDPKSTPVIPPPSNNAK